MKKILIVFILFFLTSCTTIISGLQDITTKPEKQPDEPLIFDEVPIVNGTKYNFSDSLKENGPLTTANFPSIGAPKLLVIPVTFPDSSTTDLDKTTIKEDLNIAFNGTQRETGYYSLKEFYEISSYNKLSITSDVLDFFTLSKNSLYYKNRSNGSDLILQEALDYYDETIDFSDYDFDNDGFIDGIWIIYDHPVDFNYGDFWWAFETNTQKSDIYDLKQAYAYAFAGVDFMYEKKHVDYDSTNIIIDSHTYIHETGHMMGLDDYYSYGKVPLVENEDGTVRETTAYGTYGYDMMDHTCGDHGPLSKLLLGWITPYIITDSIEIDLRSFVKTGDALLVTNRFTGSIYDHYYLIVCYDESLMNKKDNLIPFDFFDPHDGIVIYECHAEKPKNSKKLCGKDYLTGFFYNNTDYKIMNPKTGFDYNESKWFVRFLTNGLESKTNKNIVFKVNDILNKNLFFNFKVERRLTKNFALDKYKINIQFK